MGIPQEVEQQFSINLIYNHNKAKEKIYPLMHKDP
jgi:hypothetical protein